MKITPVLAALSATAALLGGAPSAGAGTTTAPVITDITTEQSGGGLTPYYPLATLIRVSFTDTTPGAEDAYQLQFGDRVVAGANLDYSKEDSFYAYVRPEEDVVVGEEVSYTVAELDGEGVVVSTSAPETFTFEYVGHPERLEVRTERIAGRTAFIAGTTTRMRFRGGVWEAGTRYITQVWVSKRKKFTFEDYDFNRNGGALIDGKRTAEPITTLKIPRRVAGKWIYISVVGTKKDKGGIIYEIKPVYVAERR